MKRGTLIGLLVLSAACSPPQATDTVDVALEEFEVSAPARIAFTDSLTLEVWNNGTYPHTLVVTNESGRVLAASGLIVPDSGEDLTLVLPEGTYQLTCRIVAQAEDGTLIDHFQEGMRASLRIGA